MPTSTVAHPRDPRAPHPSTRSCAVERESHKLWATEGEGERERGRSHGMIVPIWQDMTRAWRERDGNRRSVGVSPPSEREGNISNP